MATINLSRHTVGGVEMSAGNGTPEAGWMIYNTTTNKFQGYDNGVWEDLH